MIELYKKVEKFCKDVLAICALLLVGGVFIVITLTIYNVIKPHIPESDADKIENLSVRIADLENRVSDLDNN